MSQPDTALGGDPIANGDTDSGPSVEDRWAAHAAPLTPQEDDEEQPEAEDAPLEDAPEAEGEQDTEAEPDEPAIKPPASWTAEEKEAFAELPRNLQETVARREAERDKALYTKTQEAARVRTEVEQQAIAELQSFAQSQVAQLQALLPQIPEKPPATLQLTDPVAWAEQQDYHDWAVAQHQTVQQQIAGLQQVTRNAEQELQNKLYAYNEAILQEQFPEYLDPVAGMTHRQQLGALATELGFSHDDLANPTARDIIALRKVAELKTKADKYDALMKDRMTGVRAAKNAAPKVSRPGNPAGREAMSTQRLKQDREAMARGDRDAGIRVFSRYV